MFTLLESDLIYLLVPNEKLWFSSTL